MSRRGIVRAAAGTAAVVVIAGALIGIAAPTAQADGLVAYSDCDEFLAQQRAALARQVTYYGLPGSASYRFQAGSPTVKAQMDAPRRLPQMSDGGTDDDGAAVLQSTETAVATSGGTEASAPEAGPTGTNLQESGVDEPDRAKLADGRLVVLDRGVLHLLSTGASPQRLGAVDLSPSAPIADDMTSDEGPTSLLLMTEAVPSELMLIGDRAVVIGVSTSDLSSTPAVLDAARKQFKGQEAKDLEAVLTPVTTMTLVDLSGASPRILEQRSQEGEYLSARLVNGTLRVVTWSNPAVVAPYNEVVMGGVEIAKAAANALPIDAFLPSLKRTAADGSVLEEGPAVACSAVAHPPEGRVSGVVTISSMRPEVDLGTVDSDAVVTEGGVVYAADDRMYVVTSRWPGLGTFEPQEPTADLPVGEPTEEIHAFATDDDGGNRYVASGSVKGSILGRWALSRHYGVLRVATTRQPDGPDGWNKRSASLVKLVERDGDLVETGRVDGLAPGEDITAVRYMGTMAAVVTFEQVDPLFLIDLAEQPKVMGELKLPGFSGYLHPLGDGLLMGIGPSGDDEGNITGMQVTVFNISAPADPILVSQLPLSSDGDAWTPIVDDSRAFTYDPERRLLLAPVTSWGENEQTRAQVVKIGVGPTGTLTRLGALTLPVSPEGGDLGRVLLDGGVFHAIAGQEVVTGQIANMGRTSRVGLDGPMPATLEPSPAPGAPQWLTPSITPTPSSTLSALPTEPDPTEPPATTPSTPPSTEPPTTAAPEPSLPDLG